MILVLCAALALLPTNAGETARDDVFSVKDFGAVGSGEIVETRALQSAIDAAHEDGGGTVLLPPGTYRSGTIHLKSNVTLHLEEGAKLLGSRALADYERGNWPALVMATHQTNIAITGPGVIDGNSDELVPEFERIKEEGSFMEYFPRVKPGEKVSYIGSTGNPTEIDPHQIMAEGGMEQHLYHGFTRPSESVRPQVIEFRKCKGVRIQDVTLQNSANWVQTYRDCEDMKFFRMKVRSTKYWNNDGVDLVDCRRVEMLDCDIDSADDALCFKSEPFGQGCEDIVVSRVKLASRASAIKFGTASHIGFKRIHISDVEVRDTYRSVIAIQSVDGAQIEDIVLERVKAVNTGNAVFIRLGHRNQNKAPGYIRDVVIRDMEVRVPPLPKDYYREIGQPHNLIPASIVGMPGHLVQNVLLEDVKVTYGGGADPEHAQVPLDQLDRIPQNERNYPEFSMWGELPAWAFYFRHAQGVTFRDVEFDLEAPDFRPAVVADDAADLRFEGVTIGAGGGEPVLFFKDSPRPVLTDVRYPDGTRERVRQAGTDSSRPSFATRPTWVDNTRAQVYGMAAELQRTLRPWPVPDREYDIADFGAIADGETVNTSAIQAAIDACTEAGGGAVIVQGGDFVTGTIDLRSNVMLEVRKGARLLGSLDLADYPDRVPLTRTVMDSNMDLRQSLIYAERCVNIGIRGEGVIDGRGTKENFPGPTTIGPVEGRPFLIRAIECKNVNLHGIALRDAASWMQNYLLCENVILDGITVDSRVNGNNDGIDIDSSRNVIVRNCVVRSGDDAMCFKGAGLKPTENVLVENCEFWTWCNALKFGTDTQAAFRNVLVRNCRLGGNTGGYATTGITWASVDGGMVQDVVCENLTIDRAGSPIFIRRGNRARTLPEFPKPPVGEVRRLVIENVDGTGNGVRGSMISGIPGYPVRDIYIKNVRLESVGEVAPDAATIQVPENESGYPDAGWFGLKHFPAYGFFIRHADGVTLEDVTVIKAERDPRQEISLGPAVLRFEARRTTAGGMPTRRLIAPPAREDATVRHHRFRERARKRAVGSKMTSTQSWPGPLVGGWKATTVSGSSGLGSE